MARRFIRRSKKNDKSQEEMGRDLTDTKTAQTNSANAAVISDIAQGFMEAQANLAVNRTTVSNQEILMLLQQINEQLKQKDSSAQPQSQPNPSSIVQTGIQAKNQQQVNQDGQQKSPQAKQQGQQVNSGQNQSGNDQSQEMVSQQLQNLFSQLLQSKGAGAQGQAAENDSGDRNQQDTRQKDQSDKKNSVAVQTAAQVLAQAQYELANELEASLKKLKQVISESEKIANKISNLLGEENTSNNK